MANKHGHTHGDEHAVAKGPVAPQPERIDAAEKSLSEALGISFVVLKVIMILLVLAFLVSGFKTVGSNEQALRLIFGRIQGVGEERVLDSGWHWVFPFPVGEIVKIPVKKQIKLTIGSFWYRQTRDDILGEGPKPRRLVTDKLNPLAEGYCLTRSQKGQTQAVGTAEATAGRAPSGTDVDGSDYNIVHCWWEIDYQIDNIEKFFSNTLIADVQPGQVYEEVMINSMTRLLRSVVENAVVTAMVQYSIDEALQSRDRIPRHVRQLVQKQLVDVEWPKQVDEAFKESVEASQRSQQTISEARTYGEQTLADTAGQMADPLYRALMAVDPNETQLESLWTQVAGQARDVIEQARAYRTKVVEAAKANANYLSSILPEFNKRPELVTQRIYLDAIEKVLQNADEKFILEPSAQLKGREIRVLVSPDPSLKSKQGQPTQTPR